MGIQIKTREDIRPASKVFLEFTGNCFIDAGILGFMNLMEGYYYIG